MKLSDNKPVFLQIKAWIEDHILRGEWRAGEQLPSVRELSVRFGVNANTVVRTYERLLFDGSVRSVRGVGFFVADNARDAVVARRREEFYAETLPAFVEQMELLGVGMQEVARAMIRRTSNRFALAVAAVFVVLPALSLTVNSVREQRCVKDVLPLMRRISDNDIHVVELTGRKASEGMLYVQNAWRTLNVVELNVMPRQMSISGDTLRVVLDDESDVYQGRIILANLKSVIRNGETTMLREH